MKKFSVYYCEHDDSVFIDNDDEDFGVEHEFIMCIDKKLDRTMAERVKVEVQEEFNKTGKIKPRCD